MFTNKPSAVKLALSAVAVTTSGALSSPPLQTVPWNGHIGAVSFTFDDGLENQATTLKAILDTMPSVKVTFFIPGTSEFFRANPESFVDLLLAGNEIANHSESHEYLTNKSTDESFLQKEILDFAEILENELQKFPGASDYKVTAFATPYCASDDNIRNTIGKKHFINRDCGDWGYRNAWDTEPQWFKFPAKTWTRSAGKVSDFIASLDTAASKLDFSQMQSWENIPDENGQWMVTLNHGVALDNDEYSINPDDISQIISHAVENKMWTAPFSTIAAYHMSHFAMDSATATKDGDFYSVKWDLPSENMPSSIPLKVRLNADFLEEISTGNADSDSVNSLVIVQGNEVIFPDSNGIYTIEFTKLSLTIRKATQEELKTSEDKPESIRKATRTEGPYIEKRNFFDLKGRRVKFQERKSL